MVHIINNATTAHTITTSKVIELPQKLSMFLTSWLDECLVNERDVVPNDPAWLAVRDCLSKNHFYPTLVTMWLETVGEWFTHGRTMDSTYTLPLSVLLGLSTLYDTKGTTNEERECIRSLLDANSSQ